MLSIANKNTIGQLQGVVGFSNTQSVLLDGVDECIDIDDVLTSLAATTVGTISMWIKIPDATPAATARFWAFGDTNASEYISLHILTNGKIRAQHVVGGTSQWVIQTDAAPLTDATWHNITLVQNATLPVIYVDAVAVAQTATTSTDTTTWFSDSSGLDNGRIGCLNQNSGGNTNYLEGNIDEMLFVNRALTSGQVTTLYNSGTPKDETGIVNGITQFRIDGDIISTCSDFIGSNDGTYVNVEQGDIENDVP